MALPKTITLRLTRDALKAVPKSPYYPDELAYCDNENCLVCQSVRRRFPDVTRVFIVPGWVKIDDVVFTYNRAKFEEKIVRAHHYPHKFKPFSIKLIRSEV